MDNTRETEVARRWLLSDYASAAYQYWRDVTREIIAETKGVTTRAGWTRREAAFFLLADQLQTDIAGDSGPHVKRRWDAGETLLHRAA